MMQALMELDCIPAGMELFPAADEEQLEFIKRVIDDCDYYLLIIGGRYGTLSSEGISFTEQEYDYAVSRGLRVIALLHEAPEEIPLGKSEKSPDLQAMLESFRQKVKTGRLVRFWKSADELPGLAALSLSKTIKMFPAVGWIRADKATSEDILSELNESRKLSAQLAAQLDEVRATLPPPPALADLAGLDDAVTINGTGYYRGQSTQWRVTLTWGEAFALIAPYLIKHPNDAIVKEVFDESLSKRSGSGLTTSRIDDQDFQTIGVQLRALGLVKMTYTKSVGGGMGLFWSATKLGDEFTLRLRAVRK